MKALTNFRYSHSVEIPGYTTEKRHRGIGLKTKRITPFLMLILFLSSWFLYALVTGGPSEITARLFLYPFLLVNIAFADFATWNYLARKKLWLIWILESIAAAIIIYWLL